MWHLKRCDVSTDVDGMATGVRWVRRRALGDSHGEKERLFSAAVHELVVLLHSVEEVLRGSNSAVYEHSEKN